MVEKQKILWVDDDDDFLLAMRHTLTSYEIITANSTKTALSHLQTNDLFAIMLDVGLGAEDGIDALKVIKEKSPSINVIMVTGCYEPDTIVKAIMLGAFDYLCKPISPDNLDLCLEKVRKERIQQDKYDALVGELNSMGSSSMVVGSSPAMKDVLEKIRRVKGFQDVNVLIEGESGTGKELLARHIHRQEGDPKRPFIAINCAVLHDNLIESELFGHEKGAFTGATERKVGKFAIADGGDIFLDEISTLRLDLQAKLLRVIQEGEFSPLGSNEVIRSKFRVISATNDNIGELVEKGKFRLDLYHRLMVVGLKLPALTDRKDDVVEFANHFLKKYSKSNEIKCFSEGAIERLKNHCWKGNIRELENVVQSSIIFSTGKVIEEEELTISDLPIQSSGGVATLLREHLARTEMEFIESAMKRANGNMAQVARDIGISRSTLFIKMKGYKGGC